MKHQYNLTANVRRALGKGASRRLRRENTHVPAIVYGGTAEPQPIAVEKSAFYKAMEDEAFFSSILDIDVEGTKEQVIVRDLQRHPYKPVVVHADFMRVDATHELTMTIPLHFANTEECEGVKVEGGVLHVLHNDVEITCLPNDLPEYLEVDVLKLSIGDTLHLSDIPLPKGVTLTTLSHGDDFDAGIVSVTHPDRGTDEAHGEGEPPTDVDHTDAEQGSAGEPINDSEDKGD
ncbi:LSU ribosomal protein L25P [Kushneria sinocarnis]|uniref:Large ribosomal subunit protein bL25 n=1 Tax=Kushneria sinocarnis TaxID=595502 RepID=A0A420WVJ1_9GAMM|nr:50S ribosomal protein L25/general stress protein Ctc [Kushneria sinocarnis]RKR02573.1 LSU ribosomal protein L25P [Kushneria sinocarnis]